MGYCLFSAKEAFRITDSLLTQKERDIYDSNGEKTKILDVRTSRSGYAIRVNGKVQRGYYVMVDLSNGSRTVPCLISKNTNFIAKHNSIGFLIENN